MKGILYVVTPSFPGLLRNLRFFFVLSEPIQFVLQIYSYHKLTVKKAKTED